MWIGGRRGLKREGFWVGIRGKKREEQDRSPVRERELLGRERECCREVRESNTLTLFFSVFKIILIKSFLSLAICGKKIMHLISICLIC